MKYSKKVFLSILIMLSVFLLSSCKIRFNFDPTAYKNRLITSGDFKYLIYKSDGNEFLYIMELSEEGLKKDTIVIPSTIDGKKVSSLGGGIGLFLKKKRCYLANVKNIYFTSDCSINNYIDVIKNNSDLNLYAPYFSFYSEINVDVLKTANKYVSFENYNQRILNNMNDCIPANVSYCIENSIYFVDDCDETTVNVIPPDPIKEGYRFDGWYKDKDYNEKWNFETDIVPPKQYGENGNYIYQETCIYAKFTYIG